MTTPDITVAILDKGANAQVRVTLSSWRGKTKVHVRQYAPGPVAGQWWHTDKGACLDVERLPELVAALQEAEREARARGLLTSTEVAA